MYRKTYVEIDENILRENVKNVILNYPKYDYYFGVVKANAYGHGEHIVNALIEGGINYLACSSLEEAISIRKYNKEMPILCFGYIDISDVDVAFKNNITITITSYDYYRNLIENNTNKGLKVHLKLNSGMNRYGVGTKEEVKEIVDNIEKYNIILEGIYTHYATSGTNDIYWDMQTTKFEELTSLINLNEIPIVHLYNSLALVKHDKLKCSNGVRIGLAMYGYSSSTGKLSTIKGKIYEIRKFINTRGKKVSFTHLSNNLKLRKALKLYSEVVNINYVLANNPVGYRASYIPKEDSFIAVVPIGHADGINKFYKYVKINNKKYPIVALCMDAIMIKVDSTVKMHDKVTIIDDELSINSIAINSDKNVTEILDSISTRVPRVHIKDNERTEIKY